MRMTNAMFRCPNTGMNVQQWMDDQPEAALDAFATVKCPACGRVHFINCVTHRLLGHESTR
jgi:predicted RNA-binding Zn-ribbon protein involved in translation (DUF1610 family)